ASDRVIVRGDELFELGPAALLRLPLVGLLSELSGGELVAEGSHGVRLGRQMLDEHPQPPPRPLAGEDIGDVAVPGVEVRFYRLRVRPPDRDRALDFPSGSPDRSLASDTNSWNSCAVGSSSSKKS